MVRSTTAIYITESQKNILIKIQELLKSEDIESIILGFGLFKNLFSTNSLFDCPSIFSTFNPEPYPGKWSRLVTLSEITEYFNFSGIIIGQKSLLRAVERLLTTGIYYKPYETN